MSISVRKDQYLYGRDDVCGEIVFFKGTINVREKDNFRKKESYVDEQTIQLWEKKLINRPRKCLNWKTPYEVFYEENVHLN